MPYLSYLHQLGPAFLSNVRHIETFTSVCITYANYIVYRHFLHLQLMSSTKWTANQWVIYTLKASIIILQAEILIVSHNFLVKVVSYNSQNANRSCNYFSLLFPNLNYAGILSSALLIGGEIGGRGGGVWTSFPPLKFISNKYAISSPVWCKYLSTIYSLTYNIYYNYTIMYNVVHA